MHGPMGRSKPGSSGDGSKFKYGENLKGENKLIEEVTRENALFVSAAAQHRHAQLMPIFQWFRAIETVNLLRGKQNFPMPWPREMTLSRLVDEGIADARQMSLSPKESSAEILLAGSRPLLRTADVGIVDIRIDKTEQVDSGRRASFPRFQLKHQSDEDDSWLPLEDESRGTQTLFRMALPVLHTIQHGGVL